MYSFYLSIDRVYYKYQIAVSSFNSTPGEFRQMVQDAVYDRDMKQDLENSHVINWCRTTKPLIALKTTGLVLLFSPLFSFLYKPLIWKLFMFLFRKN